MLSFPGASYLVALGLLHKEDLSTAATVVSVIAFVLIELILLELPLIGFAGGPGADRRRNRTFSILRDRGRAADRSMGRLRRRGPVPDPRRDRAAFLVSRYSAPRELRRCDSTSLPTDDLDVIVIGAGPAGVVAALRAARLGARTALVTRDELGGMAASEGPVPVRTLAHAARLMREARQLGHYGISAGEPTLDYRRLLARVREVTGACARTRSCATSSSRPA